MKNFYIPLVGILFAIHASAQDVAPDIGLLKSFVPKERDETIALDFRIDHYFGSSPLSAQALEQRVNANEEDLANVLKQTNPDADDAKNITQGYHEAQKKWPMEPLCLLRMEP